MREWAARTDKPAEEFIGLGVTFARLKRTLADIGCIVGQESINRIDYAMDFLALTDFELYHEQFVARRRTKLRPHWTEKDREDQN